MNLGLLVGGAMQGVGTGITNVAMLNLEDKKKQAAEARAEAREWARMQAQQGFQKDMYATQRGHTVEDATLKREQTLEDLERQEGFVLGTTVMANNEAAERDRILHANSLEKVGLLDDLGKQAEDRQEAREAKHIAKEITGLDEKGVPTIMLLSKTGNLIESIPANATNVLTDAAAKGLSPDKQLEFWQKVQVTQKDIANQRTGLREKMGTAGEENDVQLQLQLNALDAQSDALDKQVRILAPYIGATLGNAERIEQWGAKAATMFPNLPQQEAIDEYLKGARKVLSADAMEGFVADYIADDPTAVALMTIWRNEQPGQAMKVERLVYENQGMKMQEESMGISRGKPPVDSPEVTPVAQPQSQPVEAPVAQLTAQPQEQPVAPPPVATRGTETNPTALATDELIQALPDKVKSSWEAIKAFFNNPDDMIARVRDLQVLHDRENNPQLKRKMARNIEELQGKIAALVGE